MLWKEPLQTRTKTSGKFIKLEPHRLISKLYRMVLNKGDSSTIVGEKTKFNQ
jgi:hypothetical protein